MPMLKTAATGVTSITNVKAYLEKEQRQEHSRHLEEMRLYEEGEIALPQHQVSLLRDYLGESTRALAVDVSEDLSKRNWARQMDLTRAQYGHDAPTKAGRPRTYYHFILSPSMDDACALPTLRAYATTWAEENFRSGGRLHEYAIAYHDDNARAIPHAHTIVNVTNKATGRKLHLSNDDVVALGQSAQDIGRRFGLTPIHKEGEYRHVGDVRTKQPVYLTREERELLNQGKYSWKWEVRKVVFAVAPLSDSFEDFRLKLNNAGYDVSLSQKTGYLTYTHRNGAKAKDSALGALFYMETLQKHFNRESVLADKTYDSWEMAKITKGKVPWKEDIRRAIDAVAPTVMSLSELQSSLERLYGIRMTVNRRGITYQHASGFKTRDVSIGFRYTADGLQQNAVLALAFPYPAFRDIAAESSAIVRQYLPRHARGGSVADAQQTAAHFVYRDLTRMMVRMDLVRIEDVPEALERRQEDLRGQKADLVSMRNQLMRLNHLAALRTRYEKDGAYLRENRDAPDAASLNDSAAPVESPAANPTDAALYNETLLRYERTGLYLSQHAKGLDVRSAQAALAGEYEAKLKDYQQRAEELSHDAAVYRNYLVGRSVRDFTGEGEGVSGSGGVDVQALFSAGKTLAKHQVRDFYHLEQTLSARETRLDLLRFRLGKAEAKKDELGLIRADIRAYEEEKPYLPSATALEKDPTTLGIDAHMQRFRDAAARLEQKGIEEADFPAFEKDWREAQKAYDALAKETEALQAEVSELREAKNVCQAVAEAVTGPLDRQKGQKGSTGGGQALAASQSAAGRASERETGREKAEVSPVVEDLPFEEARRRRQERLRQSPDRSRKPRGNDLVL